MILVAKFKHNGITRFKHTNHGAHLSVKGSYADLGGLTSL